MINEEANAEHAPSHIRPAQVLLRRSICRILGSDWVWLRGKSVPRKAGAPGSCGLLVTETLRHLHVEMPAETNAAEWMPFEGRTANRAALTPSSLT